MKVSITRCADYTEERLQAALRQSFELLGGLQQFIRPGDTVLLKPNLLSACSPEQCVTTHPALVKAVADLVRELGGRVRVGDSPGGNLEHHVRYVWERTGMLASLRDPSEMARFEQKSKEVEIPQAKICRKMYMAEEVLEADVIINLPKLKTHMGTGLTAGIKNLFGVVPGRIKGNLHYIYERDEDFAQCIVDIASRVKPTLTIVDAIQAMEGDGPGASGTPRKLGFLITSQDVVAVDVVVARLVNLQPRNLLITRLALDHSNFGVSEESEVEIVGESLADVRVTDFVLPGAPRGTHEQDHRRHLFNTMIPWIKQETCTQCYLCVESCPVQAITRDEDGKLVINHRKCISCYCCFEICSFQGIQLQRKYRVENGQFVERQ